MHIRPAYVKEEWGDFPSCSFQQAPWSCRLAGTQWGSTREGALVSPATFSSGLGGCGRRVDLWRVHWCLPASAGSFQKLTVARLSSFGVLANMPCFSLRHIPSPGLDGPWWALAPLGRGSLRSPCPALALFVIVPAPRFDLAWVMFMVVSLGDRNSESRFPTPRTFTSSPSGVTRLCVQAGRGGWRPQSSDWDPGGGLSHPARGGRWWAGRGVGWGGGLEELSEAALASFGYRAPGYWYQDFWVTLFQLRGGIPNWVMKSI